MLSPHSGRHSAKIREFPVVGDIFSRFLRRKIKKFFTAEKRSENVDKTAFFPVKIDFFINREFFPSTSFGGVLPQDKARNIRISIDAGGKPHYSWHHVSFRHCPFGDMLNLGGSNKAALGSRVASYYCLVFISVFMFSEV